MSLHFMLTQDAQSGMTIREAFAKTNALNVKVGTFDGLLDLLMEYWLIPYVKDDSWSTQLSHAALGMKKAFWAKSIKTDEKSVIDEVDTSLQILLSALPLDQNLLPELADTSARFARYYDDLVALHNAMGNIFPTPLTKARLWVKDKELPPIEEVIVYADDNLQLEPWQWDIAKELTSSSQVPAYRALYTQVFLPKLEGKEADITYLQEALFSETLPDETPTIQNLQWLVARDALQEVEVLAGMIQNVVKEGVSFDDIAIIIPRDGWYKDFLIQTFHTFNIPLSRAGQIEAYADLGTQWVFNALQAQDRFAPPMLFASLLSSPLMPYSLKEGQYLAQIAIGNDWRDDKGNLKNSLFEKYDENTQSLIKTIVDWQEGNVPQSLQEFVEQLEWISPLLNSAENMHLHNKRFNDSVKELSGDPHAFENAEIPALLNLVRPHALQESSERVAFLKSVHVVYEDDLMLQEVQHLFVLGFNEGHYPRNLGKVGVFSPIHWNALAKELNIVMTPQEQFNINAKAKFKKQLQCASKSISFLASVLDLQGNAIALSSSLSDMAYCFYHDQKELEPESLLNYLEKEDKQPFYYATAQVGDLANHRELIKEDLHFDQNIFELRKHKDGTLKPESPSSLEKLMISPLGWFFYRQGLEPRTWGIQELDVAIQGTIAHGVFEDCFCPENPTFDLSDIESVIEKRIEEYAAFLKQDHRRLEYEQLKSDILKASEEFKALLLHCDASVTKTEEQLTGEIFGIPVAGRTDAILNVLDKSLVLDYKKSGKKGRVSRMESGYDHQLFLYKVMLNDDTALTAYYTMNDATLIVDQIINCQENIELNIVEIDNDCTGNASELLEERFDELKKGFIELNTEDDNQLWKDRGVTATYSLEGSPLITLFMKPAEEEQ